jgi:membrane-anchored protein YejM (alkaline phosphatase superfamily)
MDSIEPWQTKKGLLRFCLLQIPIFWIIGLLYLLPSASATFFSTQQQGLIFYEYFVSCIAYLSHLAILAALPLLFLYPCAKIIHNKAVWAVILIIISSISTIILITDAILFNLSHIHFNITFFSIMAENELDLTLNELILLFGVLSVIILGQFLIYFIAFRNKAISHTSHVMLFTLFIAELFAIANLSMAQNSNYYFVNQRIFRLPFYHQISILLSPKKLTSQHLIYTEAFFEQLKWHNKPMHYPLHALSCKKPNNPPNIILIMADSLRYDAVNPVVMPHVSRYGRHNQVFHNHVSGGNSTQSGMFSLHYSISPNYWPKAYEQKQGPVFFKILKNNNYKLTSIWTSFYYKPPFDKTIYLDFASQELYRMRSEKVYYADKDLTSAVINYIDEHINDTQPFFLHAFYYSTHNYCEKQPYPHPFGPFIKNCLRIGFRNNSDRIKYHNRYLNATHFVDGEINKIITAIESEPKLNNTIVIITSDHGEEFDDNRQGYWGHLGNFTAATTHIPLIIHWPNSIAKNYYMQTTSYDLVPTILKNVFGCKNPTTDYSIGQDLFAKNRKAKPFIISGSYSSIGIIESNKITTIYPTGNLEITNKNAVPLNKDELNYTNFLQALKLIKRY